MRRFAMTRWPFLAALCATVAGGYFAVTPFGELRDPCPAFAAEATTSQNALPLVGYLASSQLVDSFVTAFKQGLSEFGYVEGRSVTIEYRSADGEVDRLPALAADLVQRHPAVIVAPDGEPSALAAKAATDTIPIVFIVGGDPVAIGLVPSLARPGGNATGISVIATGLIAKRLELLHRLAPAATTIALLVNPTSRWAESLKAEAQTAAKVLGLDLPIVTARSKDEIEVAFADLAKQHVGALLISPAPVFRTQNDQIIALAARYAIPTGYESTLSTSVGGLMSYGTDLAEVSRQAGVYSGRILKGVKPANLPVTQPARFEFVINSKTAKTLGLEIPADLLAMADSVID
jgi:putative tryptophan/tyrosine transport system substrate-binding protein